MFLKHKGACGFAPMCGRVTDIKEVGDTSGRRDTAVGTTVLGISLPIFAVVINICHISIKSWPQKGKAMQR